jgi:hypothetical protein
LKNYNQIEYLPFNPTIDQSWGKYSRSFIN